MNMSFFRNIVWYIKGKSEYTREGYAHAAKSFRQADLENISLNGRHYMVTGANSGIGKVVAFEVAKRGGILHMVCRNPERGQAAVDEIKSQTNNEAVHLHIVDLGKPVDVYKFAKKFSEEQKTLDVLVNNAGCMVHERKLDSLGFEFNFATNSLAVYILTKMFIPLLKASNDPRVVNVSSGGMLTQKLDLNDMQSEKVSPFDATFVYAQHKRQQVIMTEQFAGLHSNIVFTSMHPGWADTPAVRDSMPSFYNSMKGKLRTPEEGADTAVWLAVSPAAKTVENGGFFQDRKSVSKYLPLSWTESSNADKQRLMSVYEEMFSKVEEASS